jgi:hypothetical protein
LRQLFKLTLLLLLSFSVFAAPPLSYRAKYNVNADGIPMGEMWRILENNGDKLELKSSMKTTGFVALFKKVKVEETSQMLWDEKGNAIPLGYHYKNVTNGKTREEHVSFNYAASKATSNYHNEINEYDYQGEFDKLTFQLNLAESIRRGEKEITFNVFDKGEIREYQFRVVGRDKIKVPAGSFDVIEVERVSSNSDRKTRFWCATERDYMMVKITQDDDGHTITSEMISYELAE